jgi:hypothetical protein
MATAPAVSDAEADDATKAAMTHEVVRSMVETSGWEREGKGRGTASTNHSPTGGT